MTGTTTSIFPFHITVLPECQIDHSDELNEDFKSLMNNDTSELDCTFIIGSNKKVFYAHSFIIQTRSQKLFNLIKTTKSLELLDEDEFLFEELLQYAYTGEANVSPKEAYDFLQLSIKFGFDGVLEGYLGTLNSLNSETVVKLFLDWKKYQSIKNTLKTEIEIRADDIFSTKTIYLFSPNDLEEIVKDWELVISEKELFDGLISWSQKKIEDGVEAPLKNVIKHIRFGLFTVHEIENFVRPTKFISDDDCDKFKKSKDYNSILYKPRSINFFKLNALYPKSFAHDNDGKTIARMDGQDWVHGVCHGPILTRDIFIEFRIEKINYRDHSGVIIGVSDDLKKNYSGIVGYGMSGYKYNVKGVKTLYSNAGDKVGMWIKQQGDNKQVSFYKNSILISNENIPDHWVNIFPVCYLYYAGDSVSMTVDFKNPYQ
eukprot:gene9679-1885_t